MHASYIPTGNEAVSLPRLRRYDAAIEDFTFLHMGAKGLLDVHGKEGAPLMLPFWETDAGGEGARELQWRRIEYWIPAFRAECDTFAVEGIVLTPVGEHGFALRLQAVNRAPKAARVTLGLRGCWAGVLHAVNESKPVAAARHCAHSLWNGGPVFEARSGLPLFAFAPMAAEACESRFETDENGDVRYCISRTENVESGRELSLTLYWGLGYEEVAAATSAKEMLRQGWDTEMARTRAWLKARQHRFADAWLAELYNTNLFFCLFFSTGRTLDSEELVLVTSRSPRYYVSAAYWDRDSLLWSFPAILDADAPLAREMLLYVFGRQRRNFGVHSRFIDGTVLEPGFELDELMAPVLALERYVDKTGDTALPERAEVIEGIALILARLQERKHPETALFSTFLQPTDDEIVHPYLTYNNVLVWRALCALERLYPGRFAFCASPGEVKAAIAEHCVKTIDGEPRYAWSVDLQGKFDVYDEPPGSLQLMAWHGFCTADEPVYAATVRYIRSEKYAYSFAGCPIAEIGCPHAPHPWVLSIANSLLCGHAQTALEHLKLAKMDGLIACESVDEHTGECATGEAFATCAGFLCHALREAHRREGAHA